MLCHQSNIIFCISFFTIDSIYRYFILTLMSPIQFNTRKRALIVLFFLQSKNERSINTTLSTFGVSFTTDFGLGFTCRD